MLDLACLDHAGVHQVLSWVGRIGWGVMCILDKTRQGKTRRGRAEKSETESGRTSIDDTFACPHTQPPLNDL